MRFVAAAACAAIMGLGLAIGAPVNDAANPFILKPPDPFKQPGIPLPPQPSPRDRLDQPAEAEKPGPGRKPFTEDDAYAAYQRGYFVEAFALATERAAKGDPQAMTMLGHLYEEGQGVRRDLARAIEWFRLGADHGDREAQFELGLLYLSGTGVARDKTRDLFEAAANQDQPTALFNLAILTIEGAVVRPDIARARQLMHRAAQLGNAEAQYAYALMLDSDNLPSNETEITYWFGLAAGAGHVPAEVEYAIRLAKGRGTAADFDTAVLLLNRAAWAGNAVAQNRIAHLIATGMGMPFNTIEAAKWHLLAKAGGVQDPRLEEMLSTLKPDELTQARTLAAKWPNLPEDPKPATFQPSGAELPRFDLRGPLDFPRTGADAGVAR
jgi:TPR repeat protein